MTHFISHASGQAEPMERARERYRRAALRRFFAPVSLKAPLRWTPPTSTPALPPVHVGGV